MADLHFQWHGPGSIPAMLDTLTGIYLQTYTGAPRYDDHPEVYGKKAFIARTTRQANGPGFSLVVATVAGEIAGYSFGLVNEPGGWLPGESDPPPPAEVVNSPRFFVVELIVCPAYQGRGYAHPLMNALLADRAEAYAALTAEPGGFPQQMYQRWGWRKICTLAYARAPVTFDVMLLPLASR